MTASETAAPYHKIPDLRNRRILIVSAVFHPDELGGAEMSARGYALWLKKQGAEVGVLTTAKRPEEALDGTEIEGLKIWRVWMPRPYPMFLHGAACAWQKPLWHLLDHFDPRNRRVMARVLDAFRPDHVNIHVLQGLGYNALAEIGKRKIPASYVLHDLALACVRMNMFCGGKTCARQCGACRLSSLWKARCAEKAGALSFASPSRANLERLARFFPLKARRHAAILNVNRYPAPSAPEKPGVPRLLYVGRLQASKGVRLLLDVAERLAARHAFTLTIAGTGPEEAELRARYGTKPWCEFTGFLPPEKISDLMAGSAMLCVPSLWAENAPGVVIHALGLGLPVVASDGGGLPELVRHSENGLLLPAGDPGAWLAGLDGILSDPSRLGPWRAAARAESTRFDQDRLGAELTAFILGGDSA